MQIKLSSLLAAGKTWEKNGHSRIYLKTEDAAKILGFDWARYKTGNIKRASHDDGEISNAEMRRVLNAIEGVYYDNHEKKFESAENFNEMLSRYDIELFDDTEEARKAEADAKALRTHGGAREGAGRKPTGHITRTIRVSPEQYELLRSLGGSEFLRFLLDRIREAKVAIPVDTLKFTEEDQDRFIDGWTQAGGSTDDAEAATPWFAPWEWSPEIIVHGTTPEEWGADFYRQCKPEIDAMPAVDEDE